MMKIEKILSTLLVLYFFFVSSVLQAQNQDDIVWYEKNNDQYIIHLYFFWSEKCPHCQQALPDIIEIDKQTPWLKLHSLELSKQAENINTFIEMAKHLGTDAQSVPTFMFCGNSMSGYDKKETSGMLIKDYLYACYQFAIKNKPDNTEIFNLSSITKDTLELPIFGKISSEDYSLPVLTLIIAGMDAFNPCAFFVLLFLLSMMVHAQSRLKMALIGGIFVIISGSLYFTFMAAWLNLFIYLGELRVMTLIAGLIALVISLINIKDYFCFKKSISLSISEKNKPKIIDRVRHLLQLDSIVAVISATVILAIVANSYELLCTAGFPMIYTRLLTLEALNTQTYYLYLLLYNIIYIIPLLTIVILFTVKLGARKLSENEGRLLKLLSGVMMFCLGAILVISPGLLNNVFIAATVLLFAILITWVISRTYDK